MFCDWITLRQVHDHDLPEINNGMVINFDADGVVQSATGKGFMHTGSHSTTVRVRCDGRIVELSGNVGRFGRADNVFGYSVMQCIDLANGIVKSLGLPPFSAGTFYMGFDVNNKPVQRWTGAKITRLDLTENLHTGSERDAAAVMSFYSQHKVMRLKQRTYGHDETIEFGGGAKGSGSRYVYAKLYQKGIEMERHRSKLKRKGVDITESTDRLIAWCKEQGIIRFEVELKSTYLGKHGISYLGQMREELALLHFNKYFDQLLSRVTVDMTDDEIPQKCKGTFARWKQGESPSVFLSRSTFYKHRSAILEAGHDIAEPFSNVVQFPVRPRFINMAAAVPPQFYQYN